jgi:dephospho-CoA kinase
MEQKPDRENPTQGRELLLGVTGGIATGKTTVARLLEEKGAPIIDFDVLAREVVEPDRPAWKQIVAYFGEQVLQEDRALDRKKLSGIVFSDPEKKKKLEGFTHPMIGRVYIQRLTEIVARDPEAIVQVVVPLLLEVNMQHLFHKILLVYAPRKVQIERLTKRDGISTMEAEKIVASQLPIDEKVGYADFVIRNEGDLARTREQVDRLWLDLRKIQGEKRARG